MSQISTSYFWQTPSLTTILHEYLPVLGKYQNSIMTMTTNTFLRTNGVVSQASTSYLWIMINLTLNYHTTNMWVEFLELHECLSIIASISDKLRKRLSDPKLCCGAHTHTHFGLDNV